MFDIDEEEEGSDKDPHKKTRALVRMTGQEASDIGKKLVNAAEAALELRDENDRIG